MELPITLFNWTPWIDAVSVVGVTAGVAKAFEWFDGLISDEGRIALWCRLADVPSHANIGSWGRVFPLIIDKLFGPKALSLRFFFRSSIASILATFMTMLIYLRVSKGVYPRGSPVDIFLGGLFLSSVINVVPDYLSLILSRAIVRFMARRTGATAIVALLICDTVLTGLLSFVSFILSMLSVAVLTETLILRFSFRANILSKVASRLGVKLGMIMDAFLNLYALKQHEPLAMLRFAHPVSILLYSPFFTSMWVWLYVLSVLAIKLAQKVAPLWSKIVTKNYLDLEKKPMQSLGRIAGLIAGSLWSVVLVLLWLANH